MSGFGVAGGLSAPWIAELRDALEGARGSGGSARIVAVGIATVELERAAREREGEGPFVPAPDDAWLGARALVGPARPDLPRVVLLEPSTEGRLAAALARHGEGAVACYLAPERPAAAAPGAPAGPDAAEDPAALGEREPLRETPLGPARLVPPVDRFGPFLLVLEAPGPSVP